MRKGSCLSCPTSHAMCHAMGKEQQIHKETRIIRKDTILLQGEKKYKRC